MNDLFLTDFESAPFDIIDGDRGKNYPKQNEFFPFGHCLFLSATNVTPNGFEFSDCQFISEQKDAVLRKGKLRRGDVVLTTRGTIGNSAYYSDSVPYDHLRINSGMVILRPDPEQILPTYLYHYLRSQPFHDQVNSLRSGVAQPQLPIRDMKRIKFPLPPIQKQASIAYILSAYDDLIENNRRRIQLLEQAVRLLYKEWFVHLRFPGHEHTQIINGVPEGWEKGVVSDFYDTASGGTPSRKNPEFYGGTIRWVKTQELEDGFLFDTEEHITENAIKKSAAKLFPANAVLIAMYGATIGQVGVIVESSTCNQACCAVMPKAEGTSYEHAFLFFLNNKEGLRNLGQGAAQKNISQQVIRAYEMVLPDKLVLNMFRINAGPFLRQIRTLHAMNQKLTKARDILLPKLMNGEVAV